MSDYVASVSADLQQRYASQPGVSPGGAQAWLEMIQPALEDDPIYERLDLLTRMVEPERMLSFTVPLDGRSGHGPHEPRLPGAVQQRHRPLQGRVAVPSLRQPLHREVPGLFEQTYKKNALTGLPIGGAAGGADFDPGARAAGRSCASARAS